MELVWVGAVVAGALGCLVWWVRNRRGGGPRGVRGLEDGVRDGVDRSRLALRGQMERVFASVPADSHGLLEGLGEALLAADVGAATSAAVIEGVRRRAPDVVDRRHLEEALREELEAILSRPGCGPCDTASPLVILVVGVNGVGKTTTLGKLATMHRANGRTVLLVAADTFRAAALEQLEGWGARSGAGVFRPGVGSSPSAAAFDGLRAARARGSDVVLIDTAGRLHTRGNLMEEIKKIRRVVDREAPGARVEVLLVVDATTGQNAIAQARAFVDEVGVTGVVVTKLDGTARGGVVFALCRELGVPIRYLGTGEGGGDLKPFSATEFVACLLGAGGAPE